MSTFITTAEVGPADIDRVGHAGFAQQQLMIFNAFEKYRIKLGIGIDALREKHGLLLVVRRTRTRNKDELFLGDVVQIEVSLKIERKQFLKCEAKISKDLSVHTYLDWTMVLVSVKDRRSVEIPTWMRALFQQCLPPTT